MKFGMSSTDYVRDEETVHAEAGVVPPVSGSTGSSGRLYCTEKRVAFASKSGSIDIRLGSVDSIEYYPWTPYNWTIGIGIVTTLAGLVFGFLGPEFIVLEAQFAIAFGFFITVLGVAIIAENVYNRKDRLKIYTPGTSYKFIGKDLGNIPHAIRGAE